MRVITTVKELGAVPRTSTVACIHSVLNEPPLVLVFQRGNNESFDMGWCMPGVEGQIDSHRVFRFLMVNQLPFRLTVLFAPNAN